MFLHVLTGYWIQIKQNLVSANMDDKKDKNVITDHIKLLLHTKQNYIQCT